VVCLSSRLPSPCGQTCDALVTWRKTRICITSSLLDVRRPHPQVRKKIAGSHSKPYLCISLSFIVETGPEALAGSARIRRSKVTSSDTGSRVVLGSLEWVGTQATELLIAVHWSLRGPPKKKLRLCSYLESIQSACRFDSSFDSGQAGSGHRS